MTTAGPSPDVRPTGALSRRVLAGYSLGSLVTGAFGTVPIRLVASKITRCPAGARAYSTLRYVFLDGNPWPGVPANLNLVEALTHLRRRPETLAGKKVLLVIDQFEQWLHARREEQNAELVRALRQCEGRHVQCLVLVRDDFWMAATRFMRELEVRLLEGDGRRGVVLQVEGEMDALIKALAAFPVSDFETERPSLEEIFRAYYAGADAK